MCLPLCPYQEATPKQLWPNTNASAYLANMISAYLATRQCFNCQFVNFQFFNCQSTYQPKAGGNTQTAVAQHYLAYMVCAYLAYMATPNSCGLSGQYDMCLSGQPSTSAYLSSLEVYSIYAIISYTPWTSSVNLILYPNLYFECTIPTKP